MPNYNMESKYVHEVDNNYRNGYDRIFSKKKYESPKKVFITWDEIDEWTNTLADLTRAGNYDAIIGVQRGGLIPAVLLSHKLNMPMHTVQFSLRDHKHVEEEINLAVGITDDKGDHLRNLKYLVVDDINDSGETFTQLQEKFSHAGVEVDWAVLHDNKPSKFTVNYKAINIDKSKDPAWIVYPWESK